MACGLSRPAACEISFRDQGLNPCPLHYKVDSLPLDHQGSPDVIFHVVDEESTEIFLEPINEFSKVASYKFNIQKSIAFLYTNNEQYEKEIMKTIPFTIASKCIKYLEINLTKMLKDFYNEN